jgi:hypothetical protein
MAGRGKILTFNSRNQDSDKLTAASEQEVWLNNDNGVKIIIFGLGLYNDE